MRNTGKQIIVALVMSALVFGVGFALFSDTIAVTGTATATGTMNVVVDSATVTNNVGGGASNAASIAGDGKSVTLDVPTLEYPGASVTFEVNLENKGSVDAKVSAITPTGLGAAGTDDLVITYNGLKENDVISGNNGTDTVTVTVTWDENSSEGFTAEAFSIVFDFIQSTP